MNVRVLPVKMVELAPMAYTALHVIARRNTQVLHALKVSNFVEGIPSITRREVQNSFSSYKS